MPKLKLTDNLGFSGDVDLADDASVLKYIRGLRQMKLADLNLAALAQVPLDKVPLKSAASAVTFEQPVPVGIDRVEMTVKAEGSARLALAGPKQKQLFDPELFGDPIPINEDEFYVSLGFTASLATHASGQAADLGFGFDAGGQISVAVYKPFAKSGPNGGTFAPFVRAVQETARDFVLLGDIEDLAALKPGMVATAEGSGSIRFSAEAELLSVVNPLATVDPPGPGELKVVSGNSVKVGATFRLFGEYQMRARKLDKNRVRLGFYKKRGREFTLAVTAKSGLSAGVGNFDLFERLLRAVSKDPEVDKKHLEAGGLNKDQIGAIEEAVKAAVARKLELAASFELSASSTDEAVFDYEIDLSKLGAEGRQAVHQALDGDVTLLAGGGAPAPAGVTLRRSVLTETQKKRHTLKLNLLGIYNFISVSSLVLKGRVMYVPETGELLITDSATASRIAASTSNLAADHAKLRKVMAESFLITAAYRCSRTVAQSPALEITHSYFELHSNTKRDAMRNNLDVVETLGMMTRQEKEKLLGGGGDFGPTTLLVETRYDDALAASLFLNADGTARAEEDFERAGRDAVKALVQPGESDDYRALIATDALWKELKQLGNTAAFKTVEKLKAVKAEKRLPMENVAGAVGADYVVIRWWAQEMRGMAKKLAEVRDFLRANPNTDPENNQFKALRRGLAEHLKGVASRTRAEFGDPWGLVATDLATARAAKARAVVTGPRVAFLRTRGGE